MDNETKIIYYKNLLKHIEQVCKTEPTGELANNPAYQAGYYGEGLKAILLRIESYRKSYGL